MHRPSEKTAWFVQYFRHGFIQMWTINYFGQKIRTAPVGDLGKRLG